MTATPRPTRVSRTLGLLTLPVGLAATLGLTVLIAGRLRAALDGFDLATVRIDRAVLIAVLAVGTLLVSWLALSLLVATLCALARTAGTAWIAGERVVQRCAPTLVRRTLTLALGAGLGLALTGTAHATTPDVELGWAVTGTSSSAPATVAPTTAPAPAPATSAPTAGSAVRAVEVPLEQDARITAAPTAAAPHDQVVVEAGDSLWRIAARHLGPDASTADVAAAWPDWYAANLGVIGDDPDVLQPGQVLTVPAATSTPTAPAETGSAS